MPIDPHEATVPEKMIERVHRYSKIEGLQRLQKQKPKTKNRQSIRIKLVHLENANSDCQTTKVDVRVLSLVLLRTGDPDEVCSKFVLTPEAAS